VTKLRLSFLQKGRLKQTFYRRDTKAEEAMVEGKLFDESSLVLSSSPTLPSPKLSKKQVLSLTNNQKEKGKKKKKVG
jgi:hypothetical protein